MANEATEETTESKRPGASAEVRRPVSSDAEAERKRRMSEIIARVAEEDHDLLIKLAR